VIVAFGIEALVMVILVTVFVTQIAIPLWRGTPLLPVWFSRERALRRELARAEQEVLEQELREHIDRKRAAVRAAETDEQITQGIRAYRIREEKEKE
jgi:hypothetical protein